MTICNPREGKSRESLDERAKSQGGARDGSPRNLFSTDGPLCLWLVVERERVGFADATLFTLLSEQYSTVTVP